MDVTEQRVAASTFFLGFAARLWSIGLGTVAGYRMLVDLAPEQLLFRETDGQIALHLEHPVDARRDDLPAALADMVLDTHLEPLAAALRRLGPISEQLLQGNAASALLGAAQVFDRDRATTSGWELARQHVRRSTIARSSRFRRYRLPPHQLLLVLPHAARRPLRRLRPDPGAGKGTR